MMTAFAFVSSRWVQIGIGLLLVGTGGCKDLTGSPGLPAGTPDPAVYNTVTGAVGMYTATITQMEFAFPWYIVDSGLLTDELEDIATGASEGTLLQTTGVPDPLDERILPVGVTVMSYGELHAVRTFANQAIGALATYDTTPENTAASKAMRSELYALEGYSEMMLADLFCSGVPLGTLDFQKDFTYAPSSTTAEVYQAAIAKFDTALGVADTSVRLRYLAQIGQGRANLDLGKYAEAADDVKQVPDSFRYDVVVTGSYRWRLNSGFLGTLLSDREGHNGLGYRSSGDPRAAASVTCVPEPGNPQALCNDTLWFPVRYSNGNITLASGVEARLIEAEAALNEGHVANMLTILNTLRANVAANTNHEVIAPLGSLTDPGALLTGAAADTARIALLFRERAFWLYLTGHRQGDLRRLLRQYGTQTQYGGAYIADKVYPVGPYLAPGTGRYGTDVVAPIPLGESANPLFHGCLSNAP